MIHIFELLVAELWPNNTFWNNSTGCAENVHQNHWQGMCHGWITGISLFNRQDDIMGFVWKFQDVNSWIFGWQRRDKDHCQNWLFCETNKRVIRIDSFWRNYMCRFWIWVWIWVQPVLQRSSNSAIDKKASGSGHGF
jgi:hypothetical protein